jgi:transcriptional regulator with XRE-family HTH domain
MLGAMRHQSERHRLIMTDVGLFLARRRTELGLSGRAVAKRIGVSHVTISHCECGRRLPGAMVLARWAAALDLPAHQIPHLCEDLRYDEALEALGVRFAAANRGVVQQGSGAAPGRLRGLLAQRSIFARAVVGGHAMTMYHARIPPDVYPALGRLGAEAADFRSSHHRTDGGALRLPPVPTIGTTSVRPVRGIVVHVASSVRPIHPGVVIRHVVVARPR